LGRISVTEDTHLALTDETGDLLRRAGAAAGPEPGGDRRLTK
jgi:hypothetical protein